MQQSRRRLDGMGPVRTEAHASSEADAGLEGCEPARASDEVIKQVHAAA